MTWSRPSLHTRMAGTPWACFAAHQASEKAARALHQAHGQEAWGHAAARLLGELPDPPPRELIERARVLDNYHIPARYPNGHDEGPAFEHYGITAQFAGGRICP